MSAAACKGGGADVRKKAPRLVVGLGGPLGKAVEAHFAAAGWDVCRVEGDAGKAAAGKRASAVVLATSGQAESGYLSCAKLTAVRPHCRVVLVGPDDRRAARFARLAGAVGYLPDGAGVAAVVRAVAG
jgi:DNA-binding NarL/FixJ family response regulator